MEYGPGPTTADYASHNAQTARQKAGDTARRLNDLMALLTAKGVLTQEELAALKMEYS